LLISLRIALSDKDVVVSSGYIDYFLNAKPDTTKYKSTSAYFDQRSIYMKLGSGVRQTLSLHSQIVELVFLHLKSKTKWQNFLAQNSGPMTTIKAKQIEHCLRTQTNTYS
jgi:type I restriction enzyme S subunit